MPILELNGNGEIVEMNSIRDDGAGIGRQASMVDEGSVVFGAQTEIEIANRQKLATYNQQVKAEKQKQKAEKISKAKKAANQRAHQYVENQKAIALRDKKINEKKTAKFIAGKKQSVLGTDFNSLMGDPLQGFQNEGEIIHDYSLKGEGVSEKIAEGSTFGESTIYHPMAGFGDEQFGLMTINRPPIETGFTVTTGTSVVDLNAPALSNEKPFDPLYPLEKINEFPHITYPSVLYDPVTTQINDKFKTILPPGNPEEYTAGLDPITGRLVYYKPQLTKAEAEDVNRLYADIAKLRKGGVPYAIAPPIHLRPIIAKLRETRSIEQALVESLERWNKLKDLVAAHPMQKDLINPSLQTQMAMSSIDGGVESPPATLHIVDGEISFFPDKQLQLYYYVVAELRKDQALNTLYTTQMNNEGALYNALSWATPEGLAKHTVRIWIPSCDFWCSLGNAIGGALEFIISAPFKIIKAIPIVSDIYKGIDHVTGGLLSTVEGVATIPGKAIQGENIGKDLLKGLALVAKLGAIALTGGAAAAVIGAAASQLKEGPLGTTALGRTLLDIAGVAGVAAAGFSAATEAASQAASAGATVSQQAVVQASAQTVAATGASVGNSVVQASVTTAIQDALIAKGEQVAKEMLVTAVAKQAGPIGAVLAGAAVGGLDFKEGSLVPASYDFSKVTSTAFDSTKELAKNEALKAAGVSPSLFDAAVGIANGDTSPIDLAEKTANEAVAKAENVVNIATEELNAAIAKANSFAEQLAHAPLDTMLKKAVDDAVDHVKKLITDDPLGLARKLLETAMRDAQNARQISVASRAAQLSADNVETYKETAGTVKNIITGQVYNTVSPDEILSRIHPDDLKNNGFENAEVQSNLSNNARRLNTMIARIPNTRISKEQRALNKMAIETSQGEFIAKQNQRAVKASENYEASKKIADDLIAQGKEIREKMKGNVNLADIASLNKQANEIELKMLHAVNEMNRVKVKSLYVLTDVQIKKTQAALKVAAAEEGRYWPGMYDTAHPMLVYGMMERTV